MPIADNLENDAKPKEKIKGNLLITPCLRSNHYWTFPCVSIVRCRTLNIVFLVFCKIMFPRACVINFHSIVL